MRSDNGLAYAHGTPERRKWARWAFLFFLAWLILAVLAALIAQNGIENDLGSRTRTVFGGDVPDGVDVSFDGRDATITGMVASEAEKDRIRQVVAGADDVGRIDDDGLEVGSAVIVPSAPGSLTASDADGVVTLTGTVADEATRDAALEAANTAPGVTEVIDEMTIDPDVAPADWTPAITGVLAAAQPADGRNVNFDPDTITVAGTVADEATRDTVITDAETAAPDGWTVIDQLEVLPEATTDERLAELLADVGGDVLFNTGSSDISPAGGAVLDQVAGVLLATEENVLIAGYTDSRGSAELNQALSQGRALSVKNYLVGAGVAEGRMTPEGRGITDQFGDNATDEGRAQNRRIEITVIPETEGAG